MTTRDVRKKIPDRTKLIAALRELGLTIEQVQFDHNPALGLRQRNPVTGDTIPPANSPDHIYMMVITGHRQKTTGRKGESKLSGSDGDIQNIAKLKRVERETAEFRRRLLSKDRGKPKPPSKWPKRRFETGKKVNGSVVRRDA